MKIDFSKIQMKDIEGNTFEGDISKELGNAMYFESIDIAVSDLGHEIYHNKEVEVTKEMAAEIRKFVDKGFKAIVKKALLPILDSVK